MRKLAAMLEEGEYEVFEKTHLQPFVFKNDPGGIMYNRVAEPPDTVLDLWHPWEKVYLKSHFLSYRKKSSFDFFRVMPFRCSTRTTLRRGSR